MTTFSQLIDGIVAETNRADLRTTLVSYLQQTIRECHIDPERNTALFMWPNYAEVQVTADSALAFAWPIPDTTRYQGVQAVRYDSVYEDGEVVFALPLIPGRVGNQQRHAYQQVGDRLIFKGYGGVGGVVSVAYFQFPKALRYYVVAERPASHDVVAGYSYIAAYNGSDALKESARLLTTNWLIERWPMVLEEGLRAKVYKRLSDSERARTCYSLYMQHRLGLQNSESADLAGVR